MPPFLKGTCNLCANLQRIVKLEPELERLLKLSDINMSVDKVLELAKTIVTIQITLPQSKQTINKTMLMKRHQRIAPLFADEFWGTR